MFESPFPSNDSLLSDKFDALLASVPEGEKDSLGRGIFTRANARAWRNALAIANRNRATTQGILTQWLPELVWKAELPGGVEGFKGLFAPVSFPELTNTESYILSVAEVGLTRALDFLGAAPIVGGLMRGILGLGQLLDNLFKAPEPIEEKRLQLPWVDYSKAADGDLVNVVADDYYRRNAWTNIFSPPFEVNAPWRLGVGVDNNGRELGEVWAPLGKDNRPAFSEGLGAMPGTWGVAGHVQSPKARHRTQAERRWFSSGAEIPWGRQIVDCGKFYPALAQTCTLAWQQANAAGAPEMYTVDTWVLEDLWVAYFDTFFDSFAREFRDGDQFVGDFITAYLAVKTKTWRLGLASKGVVPELHRPRPAPLVTPDIFKKGAATPETRNRCLYVEFRGKQGLEQVAFAKDYAFGPGGRVVASGGPAWDPERVERDLGAGSRCVQWPDPSEYFVTFERPDRALLLPAIRRLRERQLACLRHTLVCAYVRPRPIGDLPAFGAFAHKERGLELREKCDEARELLLVNDARFAVMLDDVDQVDPPFAKRLRDSGVTNSVQQLSGALDQLSGAAAKAGADAGDDRIPEPLPPAGGVPFEPTDDVDATSPAASPLRRAAAVAGAAALAYYVLR